MSVFHDTAKVTTIVVIGASGFIGQHLLNQLAEQNDIEIRVLMHRNKAKNHANIKFIEGDLLRLDSLDVLLRKNCTVINLAYLAQNNLEATTNLAKACVKNQVRRLIHCSTAVVVGRVRGNWVNEGTPCTPTSAYEQTKLQMEAILLEVAIGKFDISILRPTAVFGLGGKNLLKLANELMTGNQRVNYIRSCLFNRRSLNLVCVENVVAALLFLVHAKKIDREIFIISDDDSQINNYRDIESRLLTNFAKTYFMPQIFVPEFVLSVLLRLLGKSNTNPSLKYSDQKLAALGFRKPQDIEVAITTFAERYKKSSITRSSRHLQ